MVEIADADEIYEGEMREVKVGEGQRDKVLVTRY